MAETWIKLHNKLLDWEWFKSSNMVHLWLYLLLSANWEDKTWQGIKVERGSLVTSLATISNDTGIPLISVRRGLEKLSMSKQVITQRARKWTKITICKYESYQLNPKSDEHDYEHVHEQGDDHHLKKKEDIKNKLSKNAGAYVCAREELTATTPQAENWRYLSSVRKFSLGNNPDAIAEYKRKLIAEELSVIAAEIKMPSDAQEKFLTKWCEHNPGSEKIKADYEATFNIRDRAIQFMSWWNQSRPAINQREDSRRKQLDVNEKWGR